MEVWSEHGVAAHSKHPRKLMHTVMPTRHERLLSENEIIVSKTDTRGIITYANTAFLTMADLSEAETLGAPHSIIRHPDMPRAIFKMLWERITAGREIFAYVVNMSRNGDHYWVLAHVTPTFGAQGQIVGFHSNRRAPDRRAVDAAARLYAELRSVEQESGDRAAGLTASVAFLESFLKTRGVSYDQFIFGL